MQSLSDQIRLINALGSRSSQTGAGANNSTTNILPQYPTANKYIVTLSEDGFDYTVSGYDGNYPDMYLVSGMAYAFEINSPGNAFTICDYITAEPLVAAGTKHVFVHISTTGVITTDETANGGHESGTLIWTVPPDFDRAVYRSLGLGGNGRILLVKISTLASLP